jgi:hypothetical protein
MSFAKKVHRYQKWVLGSIVAIMALTLVVSGNIYSDDEESEKVHATIHGTVRITEREWREAQAKSFAWYRLKAVREIDSGTDYNYVQFQPNIFKFRDGPGFLAWHQQFQPTQEDLVASAKELIILGYHAKATQVRASDEEVAEVIRGYLERAGIAEDDVEKQADFTQRYFKADRTVFIAAVRDSVLFDKALTLDVGGCNTSYEQVFNEKLSSARSIRVLVAGIDGDRLPADIVPVTDDQIRAKFDQERENYKMPPKVQIEYLMANFDDFRSRIKDPTPEEIQKYYDEHKREFLKTDSRDPIHPEGDGHQHDAPKEEFKPVEEVREEIIKKIKDQQATRETWNLISKISSKSFAEKWYQLLEEEKAREPKDPKSVRDRALARTLPLFGQLRDQYKAEGIELRNGTTLAFDRNDKEAFFADLGKPPSGTSDPLEWAFQAPVGEVANQIYRSDKGFALIRLDHKLDGYALDLTGPIREKIRQDLLKESASERARSLAVQIESRIRANGASEIERLRRRPDIKLQRSLYLSQTTPEAETGLTPSSLVQQIKTKVLKAADSAPPSSEAARSVEVQTIDGGLLGGDRKDWSYVVVVEDSVQIAPEIKDDEFFAEVRRKEAAEVARAKTNRASDLVTQAEWMAAAKTAPPAP